MSKAEEIERRMLDVLNPPTNIQEAERGIVTSLSKELALLHREVKLSENRIERELKQKLLVKDSELPNLKTGVVSVQSVGGVKKLKVEDTISFGGDMHFSPASSFSIIDGKEVLQISASKLRAFNDDKTIETTNIEAVTNLKGRLLIGLNILQAEQCTLYIDTSQIDDFSIPFSLFSAITFWSNGKRLSAKFGCTLRFVKDQFMGEQAYENYGLEKEAIDRYKNQFVQITLPSKLNPEYTQEELKTIQKLEDFDHLITKVTHWIEVKLPSRLEQIQDNIRFFLNPVLVINRKLEKWSSNALQHNDDFVLKLKDGFNTPATFLQVERVNGLRGEAYRELTFTPFIKSPPGSYQLCRGRIEKDNTAALVQQLEYLLEAANDIYHQLSLSLGTQQNNDLNAVRNHLSNIQRTHRDIYTQASSPAHYLKIRPKAMSEQVTVWYWVMNNSTVLPFYGQKGEIEDKGVEIFWVC